MADLLNFAATKAAGMASALGAALKDTTGTSTSSSSSSTKGNTSDPSAQTDDLADDKKKLKEDYNNFLQLFLTQLQHQDPMAPLDNSQFTNSLANLSQVEQSVKTNERLGTISSLLSSSASAQGDPVNYLGKTVEYEADYFKLKEKEGKVAFRYQAPETAPASLRLTVTDGQGLKVFDSEMDKTQGVHSYTWDGHDNSGRAVDAGLYRVKLEAMDGEDTTAPVTVLTEGTVTEAGFEEGKTMLSVDGAPAELGAVVRVRQAP